MNDQHTDNPKKRAAAAALAEIKSGMLLGLGTGSTAAEFVDLLGAEVAKGLQVRCVPTSVVTEKQARGLGIPIVTLEEQPHLDLTIDGADEIDPQRNLIKGGGGALLREKIVAAASDRMVVIADASKKVETLGKFPLPVEVNQFGFAATLIALEKVAAKHDCQAGLKQRQGDDGAPYLTDGGHLIVDAFFGRISNAERLSDDLLGIPGVVQHGLFLDMCAAAYIAGPDGIEKMGV